MAIILFPILEDSCDGCLRKMKIIIASQFDVRNRFLVCPHTFQESLHPPAQGYSNRKVGTTATENRKYVLLYELNMCSAYVLS
jgi:hypothetical protein